MWYEDMADDVILKIAELGQRYVGSGIGVVDPKIVEDKKWTGGQVLELVGNKKSHVKLWPGSTEDYVTGIIRIDGLTRYNIGSGIGNSGWAETCSEQKSSCDA
jgi:transitional endoplasmic reticulum ATPase